MRSATTTRASNDLVQSIVSALAGLACSSSLLLSSSVLSTGTSVDATCLFGRPFTDNMQQPVAPVLVQRALHAVRRAQRSVAALADDVSSASDNYRSTLEALLRPYEQADRLVEDDVLRIACCLEQAWTTLFKQSGPRRGVLACAAVESHPSNPQLVEVDRLAALLAQDEKLVHLIDEALSCAKEIFESKASLAVEPFVDPESTNSDARVFLVVRTTLDVEEGIRRMDRLDEWWLDLGDRSSSVLSLAIDYV